MPFDAVTERDTAHRILVWIEAKNRDTGGVEAAGFWTGVEDLQFSVEGELRDYRGVAGLIGMRPVTSRPGLVQEQELVFAGNSAEVEAVLRGYEPRLAPIQVHVARFDTGTGALIAVDRWVKGVIAGAPRSIPAQNQPGSQWSLRIAPRLRAMTRPLPTRRSDASQRRRLLPDGVTPDAFFKFADIVEQVDRSWGTTRVNR